MCTRGLCEIRHHEDWEGKAVAHSIANACKFSLGGKYASGGCGSRGEEAKKGHRSRTEKKKMRSFARMKIAISSQCVLHSHSFTAFPVVPVVFLAVVRPAAQDSGEVLIKEHTETEAPAVLSFSPPGPLFSPPKRGGGWKQGQLQIREDGKYPRLWRQEGVESLNERSSWRQHLVAFPSHRHNLSNERHRETKGEIGGGVFFAPVEDP